MSHPTSASFLVEREHFVDQSNRAVYNTVIQATPEQVFEVLLDTAHYGQWLKGADAKLKEKDQLLQVHSHLNLKIGRWPFHVRLGIRVVELRAPRLLTLRFYEGDFIGQMEWSVRPQAQGSWVKLEWQRFYAHSWRAKCLMALSEEWHRRLNEKWLKALKKYLEGVKKS